MSVAFGPRYSLCASKSKRCSEAHTTAVSPVLFNGSNDDGGGGSKLYARDTSSMSVRMSDPCNNTGIVENKRRTAACSIHTDNNYSTSDSRHNSRLEIQNLAPELRRSERQNAARERKPTHLPSMRLREAFSSVFSSWLLFLRGRSNLKAENSVDAQRVHASF